MTCFAVIRERGPAWDPARPMRGQDAWDEHAAFMEALTEDGFVVLGGPLGMGERRFLLVVEAAGEEAVLSRLAEDPWVPMDLLRVTDIQPWQILLRHGGPTT